MSLLSLLNYYQYGLADKDEVIEMIERYVAHRRLPRNCADKLIKQLEDRDNEKTKSNRTK